MIIIKIFLFSFLSFARFIDCKMLKSSTMRLLMKNYSSKIPLPLNRESEYQYSPLNRIWIFR